jgi:hypothetical protein
VLQIIVSIKNMDKQVHLSSIKNLLVGPTVGGILVTAVCLLVKISINNLLIKLFVAVGLSVVLYVACLLVFKNELAWNFVMAISNKTINKKDKAL